MAATAQARLLVGHVSDWGFKGESCTGLLARVPTWPPLLKLFTGISMHRSILLEFVECFVFQVFEIELSLRFLTFHCVVLMLTLH